MVHKPAWFRNNEVFVSYAPTVGINKDGEDLFIIDPVTGTRTNEIDDRASEDIDALLAGGSTPTSEWVTSARLTDRLVGVPVYFDRRPIEAFEAFMDEPEMTDFEVRTLGSLIDDHWVLARGGHGSPSADFRTGTVPYIKVSDLRAGQVNINPTNRVTQVVAERYWGDATSGLSPFDLLTPIRTSKNIGDFAVLMPGQESVVLTKEILVLHASDSAPFDNFYLLWAMSLKVVRRQWDRIVFMQTNREDVGSRYREILLPVPRDPASAVAVSQPFREYYEGIDRLRNELLGYLEANVRHHIFMSSVEAVMEEAEEEAAELFER